MENIGKYKIVRIYFDINKSSSIIKRGLSLEEAQAHCRDPKTRKEGVYFDGYENDWSEDVV